MSIQFDTEIWADSVVAFWKDKGIELETGASESQLKEAEKVLEFQFDSFFQSLYRKANGFKNNYWTEQMISVWPLKRILQEHSHMLYPNFIGFSDYLITSHVFGFWKNEPGIFKIYDLANKGVPEKITNTFEQVIELINTNSDKLY